MKVIANKEPPYKNREFLYNEIIVNGKTNEQIANEIGFSESVVGKWAKNFEIRGEYEKKRAITESHPELLRLWDYENNIADGFYPDKISKASGKMVNWFCEKNPAHCFKESPHNVTRRDEKCSICIGKIVTEENCLAVTHPELEKEWHYELNGDTNPLNISAYGRAGNIYYWKCANDHSYEKKLSLKIDGSDCSYCKSLEYLRPDMLKEWDFIKNTLKPHEVNAQSNIKVWWKCFDCKFEFDSSVGNRYRLVKDGKKHCPNCNGKVLTYDRTFAFQYPQEAKEWDYDKNEDTPEDVFGNSGHRRWWLCAKGHSYDAIISNKARGRMCPHCDKGRKTSYAEQAIYHFLKIIFPESENRSPFIVGDYKGEFDIYVKQLNLGIEYDGAWYHSTKRVIEKDLNKNLKAIECGITLIRIRETGLPDLGSSINIHGADPHRKNLDLIIEMLFREIAYLFYEELTKEQIGILQKPINNDDVTAIIQSNLVMREIENSLLNTHPELAAQWNIDMNLDLSPIHVTHGSNKKVWWKCNENHEWDAKISDRTHKDNNCPYCSGRKLTYENSLEFVCPELALEWHPTKNGGLTPADVSKSGSQKVYWLINGVERHSTLNSRYEQYKKKQKIKLRMEND